MKNVSRIIIIFLISISALTWLISVWQYDTMMSSMMTFYFNPSALSLFVVIWTAGMSAMMFPAVIPMVILYNRLINNKANSDSNSGTDRSNQVLYNKYDERNDDDYYDISSTIKHEGNKSNEKKIYRFLCQLRPTSANIILFVSSYLAIWALTGLILLIGWSFLLDSLLLQLGTNDGQQQQDQRQSIEAIYGILLIISGVYQFSSLKTRCLGYCESPLSFFMRRWKKGTTGAVKMGVYHGLYCLGCCWPYFLLMVALGWMNILWMGLFAAIIFAEKIWSKGGLWIARITGVGFIAIGILSWAGMISLPSDSMSNDDNNRMSMEMSSSSSGSMISHYESTESSSNNEQGVDKNNGNSSSVNNDMESMVMNMIKIIAYYIS
jgi:predicted metal-binding membrane protein